MSQPRARTRYVLGFVYDTDLQRVLLLMKDKPASIAGRLNGLGGKVENGEDAYDAISREVHEESGISIKPEKWEDIGWMTSLHWDCHVLRAVVPLSVLRQAYTAERERVMIYHIDAVPVAATLQSALAYIHLGRTGRAKAEITWTEDEQ